MSTQAVLLLVLEEQDGIGLLLNPLGNKSRTHLACEPLTASMFFCAPVLLDVCWCPCALKQHAICLSEPLIGHQRLALNVDPGLFQFRCTRLAFHSTVNH